VPLPFGGRSGLGLNAAVEQHHHAEDYVQQAVTSTYGHSRQSSLRTLLEAGVHFGHQAKRWNPKMRPYIFSERNGIHIIDLQQTVGLLEQAHEFVAALSSRGGKVLMVGTKKQAQDVVQREADRSNQFYVNRRWLGGTLTNFVTIRNRLRYMKQLQGQSARGEFAYLPKQEAASKMQELERLERTLGGLRDMTQLPGAIFIVDPKREHLAVHEAKRLGIPIIAITDTNCDPDDVDLLIPGNDDAIRSVRLLTAGIADAAIEGQTRLEIAQAEQSRDVGRDEIVAADTRDQNGASPLPVDDGIEDIADEVTAAASDESVAAAQSQPV
jgi:small subunit ribosomal protein S2